MHFMLMLCWSELHHRLCSHLIVGLEQLFILTVSSEELSTPLFIRLVTLGRLRWDEGCGIQSLGEEPGSRRKVNCDNTFSTIRKVLSVFVYWMLRVYLLFLSERLEMSFRILTKFYVEKKICYCCLESFSELKYYRDGVVMGRISASTSVEHPLILDTRIRNLPWGSHSHPHIEDANIMQIFNTKITINRIYFSSSTTQYQNNLLARWKISLIFFFNMHRASKYRKFCNHKDQSTITFVHWDVLDQHQWKLKDYVGHFPNHFQ